MTSADRDALAVLAGARVYFGHQSVGQNLMAGLTLLAEEADGTGLRIVTAEEADATEPEFIHGRIGANGDPVRKIDDFVAAIDGWQGSVPDVALMKLCYIDFETQTDVDELYRHYRRSIDGLAARHPGIVIVHATVPLTTYGRGNALKRLAYRILGKPHDNEVANVRRQAFNEMLLAGAVGEPVFDIARVESTRPDGSRVTFEVEGRQYPSLNPDYSSDGGHLNEAGRRVGAWELARVLAGALEGRPGPDVP
jgi:hypothetical protein